MGVLVFDGIFQSDHMHGALLIDILQNGGQRGGLTGTGGAGEYNDAVEFLGHVEKRLRQLHIPDSGHFGFQLPQYDGILAGLGKDVDPETGFAGQAVGQVAGPGPEQGLGQPAVPVNQVHGHCFGLKRRQGLDGRLDLHRQKLTGTFHLKGPAHREIQIRNRAVRVQHTGQNMIDFLASQWGTSLYGLLDIGVRSRLP